MLAQQGDNASPSLIASRGLTVIAGHSGTSRQRMQFCRNDVQNFEGYVSSPNQLRRRFWALLGFLGHREAASSFDDARHKIGLCGTLWDSILKLTRYSENAA